MKLSNQLDKEESIYKQKIQKLREQIQNIERVQIQKDKIDFEEGLPILLKAKARHQLLKQANKQVEPIALKTTQQELRKDDELAYLVKLILPQKLRPSLISSTINSQIRRLQMTESLQKKELKANQRSSSGFFLPFKKKETVDRILSLGSFQGVQLRKSIEDTKQSNSPKSFNMPLQLKKVKSSFQV